MAETEYFQHFKGKIYLKILEGKHTETQESLIAYMQVGENRDHTVLITPTKTFSDLVEIAGKKVPIFRKITLLEIKRLIEDSNGRN